MEKIRFSKHSIDRFKERFSEKIEDGNVCRSIARLFYHAKEDKRFLNNTKFTTYIYEKHGYDKPMSFHTNNDILFVCRDDTLVTVMFTSQSIFNDETSSYKAKNK